MKNAALITLAAADLFLGAHVDSLTYTSPGVRDLRLRPYATALYIAAPGLFVLALVSWRRPNS